MHLKSKFKIDLSKEKLLTPLLDSYYEKHLKNYTVERIFDLKRQLLGIDILLKDKRSSQVFYVDEKAQLDYINESLPTFAFEISYLKRGKPRTGWFFDDAKKTQFYALVTSIYSDEKDVFTACNITLVNRKKLIAHLDSVGLSYSYFQQIARKNKGHHGKVTLEQLMSKTEGYLYFSTKNKAEQPLNLILKLDYLLTIGVAKRLV